MSTSNPYVHPKEVVKEIPPGGITGAKVTFINMPIRDGSPPNCLPYGICLLAGILRRWGANPSIIDLNSPRENNRIMSEYEAETFLARHFIDHGEPDIVAMSGMITTLRWQELVAKMVRRYLPSVFLASGGGLATQFRGDLFGWIPELNSVSHSEGDYSIIKTVYDAVQIKHKGLKSASMSGYLDPYYCGGDHGRPRFVYDGGRPDNLDNLPLPAYDLLGKDVLESYINNPIWGGTSENSSSAPFSMNRSMNTISSRGCPFNCSFCFRGTTGEKKYGVRSAENIVNEIVGHRNKHNLDFIGLLDDNFMVNKKRVMDFSRDMQDVDINWGTHGRMDEANIETVESMGAGNCKYIGFGGESASAKTLKEMDKGGFTLTNGMEKVGGHEFPKTYTDAIRNTKEAGINGNCTWMMGFPGETLQDLKTTVAFIKWQEELCGEVNKNLFVTTAYPGTRLFSHPKVKGVLSERFNISYGQYEEPKVDNDLRQYVYRLDDATKLLHDNNGRPVNYSGMTDDQFIEAKTYVENGQIERILEMPC